MKNIRKISLILIAIIFISNIAYANPATIENNTKEIKEETKPKFREPRVFILNQEVQSDVKPFIQNGTTMVPVRAIIETIGGEVKWIPENQQILLILKNKIIDMTIGSDIVKVNGFPKKVGNPPLIKDGTTLIPARAIAEALGYEIFFREHTGNVYIQSDLFRLRSIYGPNI